MKNREFVKYLMTFLLGFLLGAVILYIVYLQFI